MGAIFKNSIPYSGGGGTEYTAGDGINIENDEISTDNMPAADMSEVASPLPSVMSRRFKYSTEEQVVGEWIDGKPVYQKTFRIGALTNSSTWAEKMVNVGADIESIVKIESLLYRNTWIGVAPYSAGDTVCMPQVTMLSTPIQVGFVYIKDFSNIIDSYITLRYTKTTD